MTDEQQLPEAEGDEGASCSFCGKSRVEVRKLIAGPVAYICDECVGLCNEIIEAEVEAETKQAAARSAVVDPALMLAELSRRVVSQEAAKRALVAARRQQVQLCRSASATVRAPRILLVGPTGSGKTTLGHALADISPPAAVCDVATLSETGYVGDDVNHALLTLLEAAGHEIAAAQAGCLFLDGLEKLKAQQPLTSGRDISGEQVQRELLGLLDGRLLPVPEVGRYQGQSAKLDTSSILVVGAVRSEPGALPREPGDLRLREVLAQLGLLGAFISRFDRIIPLEPLTAGELAAVLTLADSGLLAQARRMIAQLEAQLDITPDAVQAIARTAFERGYGGWTLRQLMQRVLEEIYLSPAPARAWRVDGRNVRTFLGH